MTILPGSVLLGEKNRETEQNTTDVQLRHDQTLLQTPLIDMDDNVMMITLMETRDGLNL